ncbi:hypothetical protein BH09MYX1_BH09MYX1_13290 [soil metagenome]
MFWDNRARSLENQARGPLTGASEMRGAAFAENAVFVEIAFRLDAIPEYGVRFQAAFGGATIDEPSILRAIATFERTLVTVPSYERWLAGDDTAISDSAKRGAREFRQDGCSGCH